MKITKSQLKQLIKEELELLKPEEQELAGNISSMVQEIFEPEGYKGIDWETIIDEVMKDITGLEGRYQIGEGERKIAKSELQEIIRDAIKEENGGWYSDEHETRADRKYADRRRAEEEEKEEEEPLKLRTPKKDPMKKLKPSSMGGPLEE